MQIAKDSVVTFHYRVAEPGQPPLESSFDADPIAVLIGHGGIIAGLDKAMLGRQAGDRFELTVAPEEGYGAYRPELVQRAPKKHVPKADQLRVGMMTRVQTAQGPRVARVVKIGMSVVDLDLNHPMAGKTLQFEIEVLAVRSASAEELDHGHAHGDGGHHH